MSEIYETNMTENKPWKKAMCVFLSVIIAFGTFVALTVGSSRLQDWLGIKSMLSAYAAEIVDTKGAAAVDEEAMLANNHVIDLKNTDGSNTVYLFSEPISFTDENGNLKTKDISVEKQTDNNIKNSGYEYTNGQNDYRLNFSTDSRKGLLAEFDDCSYSIVPISEISVEGSESKAALLNEEFEVFQYENIYGNGTNLRFYPQLNGVKDEIVLDQNIGKNAFSFELNTKNCTAVLNDDGTVSLLSSSDNSAVQTFSAPFAYDSKYVEGIKDSHYIDCKYSLEKKSETSYVLTVTVDNEWLNDKNTVYPVIIDPTTSNISNYRDAGIYSSKSSNCYGKETTCCFGRASEYGYGRVLNQFTMPTDIKKGAKINSAYMWQRETTGRTSTTYVTPYMVKDAWAEGDVTWATRPMYYTSTGMTKRNINSKSSDDPDNSYWYKFNITSAVQKWTDGSYKNNGVIFVSSEETDKEYNWRAFTSKQYSSSAMRPYTVINYTNDTTAPTVTSVTGNPTSWTKNNVTLTVNGAADNSGGAGLHSTPYSFSTTKGSYSWQSSKSKTFSANDTIYVYVRDALNNIRLVSTQNITKIDKTAPAAPTVTGNASSWTKDNVTLTASSTDSASGITAYSFSTQAGTYSWQTGKTKSFSSNATVYVYAKDNAGNISAAKTVTINKIDKTKPVISDIAISRDETTGNTVAKITASDSQSGIGGYSFDGGSTWQTSNTKTFENAPNEVSIAVKDNAGNISTDVADALMPEFYDEDNLIGILNPDTESKESIQYKIGEEGEWTDYIVPFAVPAYEEFTVYAKIGENGAVISKTVTADTSEIGAYSESNTDFSLSYKNVSFDFTRTYNSREKAWFFATDSSVSKVSENLIKAQLPDGSKLSFVKISDTAYKNELSDCTLTVLDEGFIIKNDDINYTYNSEGQLISVSNKYGDEISVTRSSSSIFIKDGEDRGYTLALNSDGNIVSVTDPVGGVINYSYDQSGNLTKVVDQAGVTLSQYSYTDGVLTKSLDKTINYSADGRVSSYLYDSGAYVNYTYNDEEKTISTESSVETTTSTTYNDALLTVSSTDEEGNTTEYTYDEQLRISTETSDGNTVTYSYDENGNLISQVSDDEEAENTYYTYDSNSNVIRQQTGESYTYYVYNENDENTLVATLKEDYKGEIPTVYDLTLTCFDTVSYNYDNGMLTKTVDSKAGETVTYTYDSYGNTLKVTTTKADGDETTVSVTDSTYDSLGNVLTSTSGEEKSSYVYDAAGRTLLADDNGKCTRTIYDSLGRTVQEISPEDYDASKDGLKAETPSNTYADATAGQTYVYASNGTLTSETNRLGKTTKYFYNDIGSKVREEFDIYKFYYLNHGELYQVKVAGVTTVSYNYDNDFKLLSETYANDDVIRYTYNDNGDVTAQYHNSNARPYVTYTYDEDGELTEKVNTDTGLKYVYGENNKVDVYKTSDNTLVQSYTETETEADEENNIEAKTDVTETHFGTTYTSVLKEKSIEYTSGSNTVQYSDETTGTDEDEKVSSETLKYGGSAVLSSEFTYDDNNNITEKLISYSQNSKPQTVSIVNSYDSKNRITATGYGQFDEYFTYDESDQLTRVDNNTNGMGYTAAYSYDNRGNVVSKIEYSYTRDSLENKRPRSTTTFTYANSGWKDQLVSVNGVELTYDANGNVLTYGDREYTWESGRNLAEIKDGSNTYFYKYDENGIRTSKTVNGVTTYFNTRDGVILSQTDGTDTWYFQYDKNGTPIGFIFNGTQYFYMTNQMGDVISITDANGEELVEYEYDEWGKTISVMEMNDNGKFFANTNPIRYRGYYYDTETGYYYLRSRYYDPSICRFINSDVPEIAKISKGITAGANSFAYCNNDPINDSDPSGAFSSKDIKNFFSQVFKWIKNKITSAIKNRIGYYKKPYLKISKGLVASLIDTIIYASSNAVVSSIKSAGIKTAFSAAKRYIKNNPNKFTKLLKSDGIKKIGSLIPDVYEFTFKNIAKIWRRKVATFITVNQAKDRLLGRIKIYEWISNFTSVGGIVAYIFDIVDGKTDGYITLKVK